MDDGNPKSLAVSCVLDVHRLPLKTDFTAVLAVYAGEHLHQSGFTCAVFSYQRQDFAGVQIQPRIVKSMYARKILLYMLHFKKNRRHVKPPQLFPILIN